MKLALRYSASPYKEWKSRATIDITNPVSTEGYEHKLALTYIATMNTDFSDIRFAQTDGKKCQYWIEPDTIIASTSCTVWIKVPAAGQTTIYMYYNNPAAKSESSGSRTFFFFDDFTGTSLLSQWTKTGSVTVSSSICTVEYTAGTDSILQSVRSFSNARAIRMKVKCSHLGNNTQRVVAGFLITSPNRMGLARFSWGDATGGTYYVYRSGATSSALVGWDTAAYHILDVCRNGTTSDIFLCDNANTVTISSEDTAAMRAYARASDAAGAKVEIDWIAVRSYTATEPTLAVV